MPCTWAGKRAYSGRKDKPVTTVPIGIRSQFASAFPSRIEQLIALGCIEMTS
jgi:hypothetical protein